MRKFSPAWFLAVHATIPFIAMLRKVCPRLLRCCMKQALLMLWSWCSSSMEPVWRVSCATCNVSSLSDWPLNKHVLTVVQAVVMPKWAIAWTVACAIVGQVLGARLERARLQQGQLTLAGGAPAAERATAGGEGSPLAARSCQADAFRQRYEGSWDRSLLIPAVC